MNSHLFFTNRKRRRDRILRKMANMRAAKERKRCANPPEAEPRLKRTTCLSWAVRDDLSGLIVWLPLKSARDVFRRVSILLQHYRPGLPI